MKHKWRPAGIYQHKWCEAECTVCYRHVPDTGTGGTADWCDTDGLVRFWDKINKLNDCSGKKMTKPI